MLRHASPTRVGLAGSFFILLGVMMLAAVGVIYLAEPATAALAAECPYDPASYVDGGTATIGTVTYTVVKLEGAEDDYDGSDDPELIFGLADLNYEIDAGGGDDIVCTGAGNDDITTGFGADLVYTGDGNDQVDGGNDDDTIYAGPGDDVILGGNANDCIYGGDGNDTLNGNDGNDGLFGEGGNDTLNGHADADSVLGGPGTDIFNCGAHTDRSDNVAGETASFCEGLGVPNPTRCTEPPVPPASLTVTKVVIGGEAGCSEFSFQVNGGEAQAFDASPDCSNTLEVAPGGYEVTEPAVEGYSASYDNCSDLVLASGDSATCTITNEAIPAGRGVIRVEKQTLPDGSTAEFSFTGDLSGSLSDGESMSLAVEPGEYEVTESAKQGWYLSSLTCDDADDPEDDRSSVNLETATATFDVQAGETVTCTFTNTELGRVLVAKQTTPDDSITGPVAFEFEGLGGDSPPEYLYDDDVYGWRPQPGAYTVGEVNIPDGWELYGITCDDGASQVPSTVDVEEGEATINVEPGERVRCTFQNRQFGEILVDKVTLPAEDPQQFTFNPSWSETDIVLTDTSEPASSGWLPQQRAYSVTETVLQGWDLTGAGCVVSDGPGVGLTMLPSSIDLRWGQTITCTFTNTKWGEIVIEKVTDPSDDATEFAFSGEIVASLSHGESDSLDVPAGGPYYVTEALPAEGWALTDILCDDAESAHPSSGTVANQTAAFYVDPGETVTCEYHNYRLPTGSLTVVKDATPNDGTIFDFGITTPVNGAASLETRAASAFFLADGEWENFPGPGDYLVTEGALPDGWEFDDVECTGTTDWSAVGQTVNVTVGRDDAVVCYFYNSGYGYVTVAKQVPAGSPDGVFEFDPSWGPDFTLAGGQQTTAVKVPAGIHAVAEVMPLPAGWASGGASCSDGSQVNAIGVSVNESVTCTFTNTHQVPPATLQVVKVIEGGSAVCSDFEFQVDGGASAAFEADCTNELTFPAGTTHTVVEVEAADYETSYDNCTEVLVDIGQPAVCTITNTYEEEVLGPTGSLTIIKETVPTGGEGFSFDGGVLGTFALDDGGSEVFTELEAGEYTVTETPADGWAFNNVQCTAGDWSASGASVTVNLGEGEVAVCTFTNGGLPYTGSDAMTMPLLIAGLWSMLMGLGMLVWGRVRRLDLG